MLLSVGTPLKGVADFGIDLTLTIKIDIYKYVNEFRERRA